MSKYPTAEDLAKTLLLYRLGEVLKKTSYEKQAEVPAGSWPTEVLSFSDVEFLSKLGVEWHSQPRRNGITNLLGEEFVDMNNQGVSLEVHKEHMRTSIVFVSLIN